MGRVIIAEIGNSHLDDSDLGGGCDFHLELEDWGLVAGKVQLLHIGAENAK